MKTRKLALLVAVLAVTFATLTANFGEYATEAGGKKVITVSLLQAVQSPALVVAMNQQIDPQTLAPSEGLITYEVDFMGYTVKVSGTYNQWLLFFNIQKINQENVKSIEIQT